ncbi:exonuclease domain-containing protein [Gordonia sp. ABSL49_1]|uniref:3'-5' exonuclease n=1 Tax=Gordonia sp. ABSL49_1 TaxID=2920941 RepID=UPI001F10A4CD|nr:exonuclease domain-containing protein [Gordonia sp. ABSL49_1]MCH5645143.1 hypothetical protein [Gordonia sp. ABSL49_1]
MTTAPIAFIDTETTGLTPDDEIWEFACIRRDPDGTEQRTILHIEHDQYLMVDLPERFVVDHDRRFGADHEVHSRVDAAKIIHRILDGTHLVGANPAFDAGMLTRLLRVANLDPSWHYHLIDLEAVTLGYLIARGETVKLPWRSDNLAARVGAPTVDPETGPLYDRHTAMGDVLWCRDWWDAITTAAAGEVA